MDKLEASESGLQKSSFLIKVVQIPLLTLNLQQTCRVMNSYIFSKYRLSVSNLRHDFKWRYLESSSH